MNGFKLTNEFNDGIQRHSRGADYHIQIKIPVIIATGVGTYGWVLLKHPVITEKNEASMNVLLEDACDALDGAIIPKEDVGVFSAMYVAQYIRGVEGGYVDDGLWFDNLKRIEVKEEGWVG
jgi:hypothetical protein